MKNLLLFVMLINLTNYSEADSSDLSFTVHIIYIALPSPTHYDYYITDNRITVKKYLNAIQSRPQIVFDSATFKIKFNDSLKHHVLTTRWGEIPNAIGGGCIDGYFYLVTITIKSDTFNFRVSCPAEHPELSKLLALSNSTIPNKRFRNKFNLRIDQQ